MKSSRWLQKAYDVWEGEYINRKDNRVFLCRSPKLIATFGPDAEIVGTACMFPIEEIKDGGMDCRAVAFAPTVLDAVSRLVALQAKIPVFMRDVPV